jgi:hypothetical protein
MNWEYLEYELPWYQYFILFAVSLELHEQEQFWEYALSSKTDPKKFPWRSPEQRRQRKRDFWVKAKAKFGGTRGDVAKIAQADWTKIRKVTETWENGAKRVTYVDEHGNDVTEQVVAQVRAGKEIFMKTKGD